MAEYIEREALKDKLYKRLLNGNILAWLCRIVDDCPAADVAPVVHGRWRPRPIIVNTVRLEVWMCSVCGVEKTRKSIYCPNCGARMDGE